MGVFDHLDVIVGHGTDRSAVGAFIQFFMELESIQFGFITDDAFAGRANEIRADPLSFLDIPLDDLQLSSGKGPNPTAFPAFTSILSESIRVQVKAYGVPTFTQWTLHSFSPFRSLKER